MRFESITNTRGIALVALALLTMACSAEPAKSPSSQLPAVMTPTAGSQAPTIPPSANPAQMANGMTPAGTPAGMSTAGTSAAGMGVAGMSAAGMGAAGMSMAGTSAAGMGAAGTGAAGTAGMDAAGTRSPDPVECVSTAPDEFEPNPSVGGGGSQFTDSPHFRIVGATGATADGAINELEAAYNCFVETLCWRSSGLSIKDTSDSGPYSKMNIYSVGSLGSAGGQMFSDANAGLSYLKVVTSYLADPKVTVHEYGHALTYHEKGWIDQTRTGAWWETVANFVADTYMTSPLCAESRKLFGEPEGKTIIELNRVIGDSYQVIVDGSSGTGNYYQAWPLLTYITNNPDHYTGLGTTALRDMFRQHDGNNETPLHVLERVAMPVKVQTIVGRYWARMAYLDIGHKQAQDAFLKSRGSLNFANLDSSGNQTWRVKASRQPRYFGSNIIPLTASGDVTVKVSSSSPFTATLSIRASSGSVRYVDLANGAGQATLASGEEASLVVVNTPAALIQYDPFSIGGDVAAGLDYTVQLTGATPAN